VLFAALFTISGLGRTHPAHAATGDLDFSFGTSGKVTTDFSGHHRRFAVVIQLDGKAARTSSP